MHVLKLAHPWVFSYNALEQSTLHSRSVLISYKLNSSYVYIEILEYLYCVDIHVLYIPASEH